MFKFLTGLLDSNEKQLKKLESAVRRINELEPAFEKLSDEALKAKTDAFVASLKDGATLDDLLPETFATVRESAKRHLGQRHFDAQLMGGVVLHEGKIAEMKTGEGKTLVATLSVYLNALTGKGVHVVTVNDYLARRDTQWMGPIYHALGLTVACLQHETAYVLDPSFPQEDPRLKNLRPVPRKEAYLAHVTHGTNNEFGFDYLRDNMVTDPSYCVQRELHYAIVDEVDNILIDEARTPLIISGQAEESTEEYYNFARLVARLRPEDYQLDERLRAVSLTEIGLAKVEKWLGVSNLYDADDYSRTHYLDNALKARVLYERDRDYVVKDGQVIIVDEFTGRLMLGRRYSEGLHQAIEAKEGVRVQRESLTLATITLQNYFRLYGKLAGMTGTAATEAEELYKIYKLEVVVIPTHKPMIRVDHTDQIYRDEESKFRAASRAVKEFHESGQPVLVGTVSIEKSERLSALLQRQGVPHQVLNAKLHEKEAGVVAQAGRLGAVTIATNMAGRGTDIILGGNPQVLLEEAIRKLDGRREDPEALKRTVEAQWQEEHNKVVGLGGLHILGTERHEARRIDNQLRGRAGRQGDPGSSRFYVSLEDDVVRRFGGDRLKGIMGWAGLNDETPLEHSLITKAIAGAQTKVEAANFDIRKHLVDYDDVMNRHREVVYDERKKLLSGTDLKANIQDMVKEELQSLLEEHVKGEQPESWDLETLLAEVKAIMPTGLASDKLAAMSRAEVVEAVQAEAQALYQAKEQELGTDNMRMLERLVMLRTIDNLWVEHLTTMEHLRQGIGLEAYGQRDPLVVYKREAHEKFQELMAGIRRAIAQTIYHVTITARPPAQSARPLAQPVRPAAEPARLPPQRARVAAPVAAGAGAAPRAVPKVGRNDPCPCGSGKKYKKCHGAAA